MARSVREVNSTPSSRAHHWEGLGARGDRQGPGAGVGSLSIVGSGTGAEDGGSTVMTGALVAGSRRGCNGEDVSTGTGASASSSSSTEGLLGADGEGLGGSEGLSMMRPGKRGDVWESHRSMNLTWKD